MFCFVLLFCVFFCLRRLRFLAERSRLLVRWRGPFDSFLVSCEDCAACGVVAAAVRSVLSVWTGLFICEIIWDSMARL